MRLARLNITFVILALLFINSKSFAGPMVKLCIDDDCRKPLSLEISDTCWSNIKDTFSSPFPSDKDEQDNIVSAIGLIESDIYNTLASKTPEADKAEDLYDDNSNKNNYRNIKNYIGVLLDNYLINRHFMRKTITIQNWTGFEKNALLLQSLTDSRIYILQSDSSKLGASPIISAYKQTSGINTNPIPVNNSKNESSKDIE